jgi:hypothetical protein
VHGYQHKYGGSNESQGRGGTHSTTRVATQPTGALAQSVKRVCWLIFGQVKSQVERGKDKPKPRAAALSWLLTITNSDSRRVENPVQWIRWGRKDKAPTNHRF